MSTVTHAEPWGRAAEPGRRVGHRVEYHERIGSTNDRARALLAGPEGGGCAVVADLQTAGRGRHGRSWTSPPGVNLMVSVGLLRPRVPARDAWWIGAAAALAAAEACEPHADLRIKWPNDLVSPDGLKVGGILVETALDGERLGEAVVGAGINVNWRRSAMPAEIAARATSLADLGDHAGAPLDRVAVLGRYLAALDRRIASCEAGASPVGALRERSWLDGRPVTVELGTRRVDGRALGIADDGTLVVETTGGRERVTVGDVAHVVPA